MIFSTIHLLVLFTLSTVLLFGSTIIVYAQEDDSIPSWVKQTALWWGQETISDIEFISSMEYLVNNNIVKITESKDDRYIQLIPKLTI